MTGGCGFIGSHFINESLKENVKILNLDNLSYSSNNINLKGLDKNNYSFIKGDVNNKKKLNQSLNYLNLILLLISSLKHTLIGQLNSQIFL